MTNVIQIQTTVAGESQAGALAAALVDAGIVACAQVLGPLTSHYRWEGERRTDTEWLVLAKTSAEHARGAIETIERLHAYEVPEIIATAIVDGSSDYLKWVTDATVAHRPPGRTLP